MNLLINKNAYFALTAIFLFFLMVFFFRFTRDDNIIFDQRDILNKNGLSKEGSKDLVVSVDFESNFLESNKSKGKNSQVLKIGFVTDAHCYGSSGKKTGYQWELNWRCYEPLDAFISQMNQSFEPDLIIDGGDLIDGRDDRGFLNYQEIMNNYHSRLKAPVYYVIGNHETSDFAKEDWYQLTGNAQGYYDLEVKNNRIIVLDGNFRATTRGELDTTPEKRSYPGYIGPSQLSWLKSVLEKSKNQKKLVFVHQPPMATDKRGFLGLFREGDKLRDLFAEYQVSAVFSGHIERLCNEEDRGVKYFALQGFFKQNDSLKDGFDFKDKGAFYEISVYEDSVDVEMYYRENRNSSYQSFLIDQQNANCWDGSTLSDG